MRIFNKRANFEYQLSDEKIEAGISLKGMEAKALREGRADITQAGVRFIGGEAFLVNASIPIPEAQKYDATRTRKLLLHRNEIVSLNTKMNQQKLQLVPIVVYNKGRLIKVQLALGKAKRKFEKKESLKRRDINREIEKELKGSV